MSRISTRNLEALPGVDGLKALLQSLAVLDAIMSPEWEDRYYSFNSRWSGDEQMGSMRNGSGDEFFALFNEAGCFIKGFAHEYPMSPYRTQPPQIWPGMLDGLPEAFSSVLSEPAFSMNNITFGIWRRYSDPSWLRGAFELPDGDDPDGSGFLLEILDGDPESYRRFAEDYYETSVPIDAVRHIYDHLPLTDTIIKSLNADASIEDLADELSEIGYPNKTAI